MAANYVSFRPSFEGPPIPAWIDSWTWHDEDWHLRVCKRRRGCWVHDVQHPRDLVGSQVFEPSTIGLNTEGTEVRPFLVHDTSRLSALLEPKEVLGPMLDGRAVSSRHAIYVHEDANGRIYFPAWLLIDKLWIWSARALRALLIPNSLDLLMQCGEEQVLVSSELVTGVLTKSAEERIRWLAASEDMRASWASVVMNAYEKRIDLRLPRAAMRGWVRGAYVRGGLLACELSSVCITVDVVDNRAVAVARESSRGRRSV